MTCLTYKYRKHRKTFLRNEKNLPGMHTNPMENARTQELWTGWGRGEPQLPTSGVGTTAGQRTAREEGRTREEARREKRKEKPGKKRAARHEKANRTGSLAE